MENLLEVVHSLLDLLVLLTLSAGLLKLLLKSLHEVASVDFLEGVSLLFHLLWAAVVLNVLVDVGTELLSDGVVLLRAQDGANGLAETVAAVVLLAVVHGGAKGGDTLAGFRLLALDGVADVLGEDVGVGADELAVDGDEGDEPDGASLVASLEVKTRTLRTSGALHDGIGDGLLGADLGDALLDVALTVGVAGRHADVEIDEVLGEILVGATEDVVAGALAGTVLADEGGGIAGGGLGLTVGQDGEIDGLGKILVAPELLHGGGPETDAVGAETLNLSDNLDLLRFKEKLAMEMVSERGRSPEDGEDIHRRQRGRAIRKER